MRTVLSTIVVLALLGVTGVGQEITERDADKLAKEYVAPKTSETRRSEIRASLDGSDPLLLQRTLKTALKRDKERAAAMELASRMRVPGLSELAWKYLDEVEATALDYLVTMQEEDTSEKLIELWKSTPVDQARYAGLNERFQAHWLPLEMMDQFRALLGDNDRGEAALAILRHQLSEPEADAATLEKDWDARLRKLSDDARIFTMKGRSLLDLPIELQGAKPVRQNLQLTPSKLVYLNDFPADWATRSFTIKLRIRADEATDLEISFTTQDENQTARFHYKPGSWYIEFTTGESAETKVDARKWCELEMKIVNIGDAKNPNKRKCHLLVDGEELKLKGIYYSLDAPLRRFSIDLTLNKQPVLMAGAEWWYD